MTPTGTAPAAEIPAFTIAVEVLLALPERAWSMRMTLADGAVVADAVRQARLNPNWPRLPQIDASNYSYGIYGRPVTLATLLRDGDRIDLLRPLVADPMDQRRRRAALNRLTVKKD